ncbi:WD40-repeat-containing domain protein [Phlyctochytrium arcticum]|nr:WD40-repeat-containing domain protein [Phlyctochytrium arcticum]
MAADGRQSQEQSDRLVAAYLKSRGYRNAESLFRKEANVASTDSPVLPDVIKGEASIPEFILFYNEAEASNPNAYERSYERLRKWIDDSIEKYKMELRGVLLPLFVHAYLDLVARKLQGRAKHFLEHFRSDHTELHGQDMARLAAITEPQHIAESDLAQNYRNNRYGIRMSRYSFELLISFLQDSKFMLLLRIVNEHITIIITSAEPESRDEAAANEEPAGLIYQTEQVEQFNQQPVSLGLLPPDMTFVAEQERVIKEENAGDAPELLEELKKVKIENAGEPPTVLPPRKLVDVQASIKALRESIKRVAVSKTSPPSICCYTFHNTAGSLQTLEITDDVKIVAGGFSNSQIRLWNITDLESKDGSNVQTSPDTPGSRDRLIGHSGPVYGLSFSSDQRYLVSCSEDKTARLWSMDTMSNLVCYKGHNYPVWDVDFSSYGWYFATASHDKTARLWSCDHIFPLRIFVGHLADVDTVRFHPNSRYIATGSRDQTARLWDVQKGACVRLFKGHQGDVNTLAISPDGKFLASAGEDHRIALWDIGSGRRIKTMTGHTSTIHSLTFTADGNALASGGADNTVRVWDVKRAETSASSVITHSGSGGANPDSSLIGAYHTKRTPIFKVKFARSNILLALGAFVVD